MGMRFFSRNLLLCLFFFFFTVTPVFGYTSPGAPTGFVNDFANMLTEEEKIELENKLTIFKERELNEIALVTIETLDGETIEEYAIKLFEEWKIGDKDYDNGILFLIAKQERELRIEIGYGLEGVLTDYETKSIIERIIVPEFKNGAFGLGITKGVEAIFEATRGEFSAPALEETVENKDLWSSMGIMFLVFFVCVAVEYLTLLFKTFSNSKAVWPGGVMGGSMGAFFAAMFSDWNLQWILGSLLGAGGLGLVLDYWLSHSKKAQAYFEKKVKEKKWHGGGSSGGGSSFGGFSSGGSSGGGSSFGGFGGGSSGGGGASGKW